MQVRLISLTSPFIDEDGLNIDTDLGAQDVGMGPEELIVYCARVSSPQNQLNMETAPRLIRYLIEHRHWSPFEMADICFEVTTSRGIAAQILRHWSLSFQEFSQRYAAADLGFEVYEARLQGSKNRQGGAEPAPLDVASWWLQAQHEVIEFCRQKYKEALEKGIAKELARFVLPLSVRTKLYIKGDVRSWIHYLQARTAPDAQAEHREIACAVLPVFRRFFPNVSEAVFGGEG